MKKYMKFLLLIIYFTLIVLFSGKTKHIETSYVEARDSFNKYEIAVNEFIRNPSEEGILKITKEGDEFGTSYYQLMKHQTVYNNLFHIEPILNKEEFAELEKSNNIFGQLHKQYIEIALAEVYNATDFSILIAESNSESGNISDCIRVEKDNENYYVITIDGSFNAGDLTNLLRGYFLIKTKSGNYFWKHPDNFSMAITDTEVTIDIGPTQYLIKGEIIIHNDEPHV